MKKSKEIQSKCTLYKVTDDGLKGCDSGYVSPNPIEVGAPVWVGSISSGVGYRTSIVKVIRDLGDCVQFDTLNSTYLIEPFDSIVEDESEMEEED